MSNDYSAYGEVFQWIVEDKQIEVKLSNTTPWHFQSHYRILEIISELGADFAMDGVYSHFRLKPKTRMIGKVEVQEPIRDFEEIKMGQTVFVVDITSLSTFYPTKWYGNTGQMRALHRGLIFDNSEAAQMMADALLGMIQC